MWCEGDICESYREYLDAEKAFSLNKTYQKMMDEEAQKKAFHARIKRDEDFAEEVWRDKQENLLWQQEASCSYY